MIYTRKPTIPLELEEKLLGALKRHYDVSLMFKPRQTGCTDDRESNSLEDVLVFTQK